MLCQYHVFFVSRPEQDNTFLSRPLLRKCSMQRDLDGVSVLRSRWARWMPCFFQLCMTSSWGDRKCNLGDRRFVPPCLIRDVLAYGHLTCALSMIAFWQYTSMGINGRTYSPQCSSSAHQMVLCKWTKTKCCVDSRDSHYISLNLVDPVMFRKSYFVVFVYCCFFLAPCSYYYLYIILCYLYIILYVVTIVATSALW